MEKSIIIIVNSAIFFLCSVVTVGGIHGKISLEVQVMMYSKELINISNKFCENDSMYSIILLSAKKLNVILSGYRCFLDGKYIVCLNSSDKLSVHSGDYEGKNLSFRPYFYNINLNHYIIGTEFYTEMRDKYGYPDLRLFRVRDNDYFGIVPISEEEYKAASFYYEQAQKNIASHANDGMWSCRTRADVISILRIAEGAYWGKKSGLENEIVRYIYDNIDKEINLEILCEKFGTNRTSLSNLIKEKTGMPPMKFILETRLTQSCPVLLFTEISINEIAEMYGFSDANYYIRSFKKRFGKTPVQYRKDGVNERKQDKELFEIHREKSEMTVNEFCNYYKKGLGKAIVELKKQEDKTLFKEPFLECIFEENHRVLNFYEKEILDIFGDEKFTKEIEEKLLDKLRTKVSCKPIPLLILMGKRHEVEEIIENYYKTSYEALTQYTKKPWDGDKYPPCAREYMTASAILGRYLKVGDKRIKEILFDIASLYEYMDFPVIPTYQNPLFQIWDGVGRYHFFMILDEVIKEHKYGKKIDLRNEIVSISGDDKIHIAEKADISDLAEEIIKSNCFRYDLLNLWLETNDEETIERVARAAIEETEVRKKADLLLYFSELLELPKKFPLDVSPLVEWLEKENYCFSELGDDVSRDVTRHIFDILKYNRQDICRKVGLKMFCDERFQKGELRSLALEIRFGINYVPKEDKDDFLSLFHSPNENDRIIAVQILERDIRLGVEGLPLEMIPVALESILDCQSRYFFCELLAEKGIFPEELKEEFLHDYDMSTRELFLKTQKPKKQPFNVFLKPPQTPEN